MNGKAKLDDAETGHGRQASDQSEPKEPGLEDVAIQVFYFRTSVRDGMFLVAAGRGRGIAIGVRVLGSHRRRDCLVLSRRCCQSYSWPVFLLHVQG